MFYNFVIIGGGVAGVTCAQELSQRVPNKSVLLISSTPKVKVAENVQKITANLDAFEVVECPLEKMEESGVKVLRGFVTSLNVNDRQISLKDGTTLKYDSVCLCTGARPRLLLDGHPNIIGIRDTESVFHLAKRLEKARRVMVVGNGGIALELIYAVRNIEVVWVTRDSFMGNTFFDASVTDFFAPGLGTRLKKKEKKEDFTRIEMEKSIVVKEGDKKNITIESNVLDEKELSLEALGSSLGPKWLNLLRLQTPLKSNKKSHSNDNKMPPPRRRGGCCHHGKAGVYFPYENTNNTSEEACSSHEHSESCNHSSEQKEADSSILWESCTEVEAISYPLEEKGSRAWINMDNVQTDDHYGSDSTDKCSDWPLLVRLRNGSIYGCDFLVSATGVTPNTDLLKADSLKGPDNGYLVDKEMRILKGKKTKENNENETLANGTVFAAGDCASVLWPMEESPLWFQMRLWSQARTAGSFTAQSMANQIDELGDGFRFEIFSHASSFFGCKVVLLGAYNGQRRGKIMSCEEQRENGIEVLVRLSDGTEPEYIKVVLENGRVIGALLIGDTGLEETIENLILDQLNLHVVFQNHPDGCAALLDGRVDIDDFFD
eukprot:g5623.t1